MGNWNFGMLGFVEWDLFFKDGTDQFIKSDHHPLSIPNIPVFHSESEVNCTFRGEIKVGPSDLSNSLTFYVVDDL